MKQINKIIMAIMVIILIGIGGTMLSVNKGMERKDSSYLVAINRIEEGMRQGKSNEVLKQEVERGEYLTMKRLAFLAGGASWEEKQKFFQGEGVQGEHQYTIRLLEGQTEDYIRYEYEVKKQSSTLPISCVIGVLVCAGAVIIGGLLYFKYALLQPFHKIESLPYELAKGNYECEIKESRSKYFGRFLWGLDRLRQEFAKKHEQQLEAEKEKKLMILSVSHDIKTPLSSIYLYTKALSQNLYPEEEKRQEIYEQIGDKVKQIEAFVQQIEKMSTTDLLKLEVHKEERYLHEFIEPLKEQYAEKFALRKTRFTIRAYDDRLVYADVDRVQQVFQNLFENAMKYGDGRQVVVSFEEEDYCQLIRVYSSGGKLESKYYPHVFESFWRGENATGKKGSGLGLYICKQIMTKLDGDIFVEEEEEGMAFVVVFAMN